MASRSEVIVHRIATREVGQFPRGASPVLHRDPYARTHPQPTCGHGYEVEDYPVERILEAIADYRMTGRWR